MNKLDKIESALNYFTDLNNYAAELKEKQTIPPKAYFDYKNTNVHTYGWELASNALKELKEYREMLNSPELVKIPKGVTKIGTGYVKVEQQGDKASLEVVYRNPDGQDDKVMRRESFLFPAINTIKGDGSEGV